MHFIRFRAAMIPSPASLSVTAGLRLVRTMPSAQPCVVPHPQPGDLGCSYLLNARSAYLLELIVGSAERPGLPAAFLGSE